MSFLEVKNLSSGYGRKQILHSLSFSVESGTVLGILGANGCGKTTLLKTICGILPHGGSCSLDGQTIDSLPPRKLAQLCSYIPQRSGIGIDISALDVVLMGFNPRMGLLEYPGEVQKQAARQALAAAGLAGMEERNYQTLSEGQKQLCILARTLVSDARLLLLDEPESALDFGGRYRMLSHVRDWTTQNRAALITLHDPQLALNCCDSLLLLQDGSICAILHPRSDSAETMEPPLTSLYGDLTLQQVPNHHGQHQWVMVK